MHSLLQSSFSTYYFGFSTLSNIFDMNYTFFYKKYVQTWRKENKQYFFITVVFFFHYTFFWKMFLSHQPKVLKITLDSKNNSLYLKQNICQLCLNALAKIQSARGASYHPALMSNCSTYVICLSCIYPGTVFYQAVLAYVGGMRCYSLEEWASGREC